MDKKMKVPGPDHPISIEASSDRIVVSVGGHLIADTRNALILREANYPEVHYIPRKDADMTMLMRTNHTTYCPYKGDCSYYSVPVGGAPLGNAVWTYEHPFDAVSRIKEYLAFYSDRVQMIVESAKG